MARSDVLVVGGGFTGLATAAMLANGERRIVVLEARTGPDPRFRGELIHPPGVRQLEALGFLREMRPRGGTEVLGFAVVPERARAAVQLPYDPAPRGAGPGYAMDHQLMVDVMREVVGRLPGVEIRTGERATEVLREGGRVVGVRTARGVEARAGLTLIAEGRLSKLRGQLGLDGESRLLSYSVALLAEGAALPYPGHGHVVIGPPGPVLAYPIGGAVRFCVDVPLDTSRGREAIARRLREEYAPLLPDMLGDAMHAALDRGSFELCASHQVRTHRCVVPGAALIGDAGGCSHPITATGMTTCLHDVQTLSASLDLFPGEASVYEALRRYERERYRYVHAQEILTERLYDVFLGHDDGMRALRDGMLAYWKDTTRARVASMGLLSGQRTGLGTFAREFTTVLGYATRAALHPDGGAEDRPLRERVGVVASVMGATYSTLRRATVTAVREAFR